MLTQLIPIPRLAWDLPSFSLPKFPEILGAPEKLVPAELQPCGEWLKKFLPAPAEQSLGDRLDLEKWTRWFRETPLRVEHPLDPQTGAPFLAFVGVAALLHLVFGWGLYHYFVKSKDPEVKSPVEAEFAQSLLREWQKDPTRKLPYWSFFLTVENPNLAEKDRDAMLTRLAFKMAEWKDLGMPALVRALYWDFLQHYGRDFPRMTDYLGSGKGNCAAQTKLVLAMMSEKISLPPNEGFGVQVFQRHLAPVHYKKNSEGKVVEVRNLMTGRKKDKVVAPIYQPPALIAAFVKAQGVTPAVSFDQLLVVASRPEDLQKVAKPTPGIDLKTSGLEFPATEAEEEGDAPEDAFLPPPEWEGEPTSASTTQGPGTHLKSHLFNALPEWKQAHLDEREAVFALESESPVDPKAVSFDAAWFFRKAEDRDHFYKLFSLEDRVQFLQDLVRVILQRKALRPEFQKAIEFFNRPEEKFSQFSQEELETITQFSSNLSYHKISLREIFVVHGKSEVDVEKRWTDLLTASGWQKFRKAEETFFSAFQRDFANFLLLLDKSPDWGKRAALFQLMSSYQTALNSEKYDFAGEVTKFITNPALVGIGQGSEGITPYRPLLSESNIIEVESPDLLSPPVPKTPVSTSGAASPAKTRISRELMMQLILGLSNRDHVPELWTDEFSSAFSKVPPAELIDRQFIQLAFVRDHAATKVAGGKPAGSRQDLLVSPYLRPAMRGVLIQIKERRGEEWFFRGGSYPPPKPQPDPVP